MTLCPGTAPLSGTQTWAHARTLTTRTHTHIMHTHTPHTHALVISRQALEVNSDQRKFANLRSASSTPFPHTNTHTPHTRTLITRTLISCTHTCTCTHTHTHAHTNVPRTQLCSWAWPGSHWFTRSHVMRCGPMQVNGNCVQERIEYRILCVLHPSLRSHRAHDASHTVRWRTVGVGVGIRLRLWWCMMPKKAVSVNTAVHTLLPHPFTQVKPYVTRCNLGVRMRLRTRCE